MEEIILNNIWATLQAIQREMERQTELLSELLTAVQALTAAALVPPTGSNS